jgi:hypothetical protein
MRSILSAVGATMRGALNVLKSVVSLPGRIIGAVFGGGADAGAAPELPQLRDLENELAGRFDRTAIYENIARAVMGWCADSMIADRPQALPAGLPIAVREWLPGLTRDECDLIISADKTAVSSHVQNAFTIKGVRRLGRLPAPPEWPAETAYLESAGFAAIAALGLLGPERSSAPGGDRR